MPEILLEISSEVPSGDLESLQSDLRTFADVQKLPAQSYDFASVALMVAFAANAIQIADTLEKWLKRTHANRLELHLSDGRVLKMESNGNPDDFIRQVKAALKNP